MPGCQADMDIVHLFVDRRPVLEAELRAILATAKNPAIALWISWPKEASRQKHRHAIIGHG